MKWSNHPSYEDTIACEKHVPLISLDVKTIIESCSIDDSLMQNLRRARRGYLQKQHAALHYTKFNEAFFETVGVTGTEDYFVGQVKFNYAEYIAKLKSYLSADNLSEYSEKFVSELLKKVEELRKITTNKDLKEKFPKLQEEYVAGINYYNDFTSKQDFLDKNDPHYKEERAKINSKSNYYYQCGLRYSISKYVAIQTELLERMIKTLPDMLKYIDEHPLNKNGFLNGIDHEKFELYVASEYLKQAKKYKNNHPNKLFYLHLLGEYFVHVKNRDLTIANSYTGEEICLANLYEEYISLISAQADWEFLPEGEVVRKPKSEDDKPKTKVEVTEEEEKEETLPEQPIEDQIDSLVPDLSDPEVIKELTGASEVGETETLSFFEANKAKVMFYKDSGYIGAARGVKLNKGYTAFIYPNGAVVMDLIASKDHIKEAIGNGIYVVEAKDFIELSMLSKATLRSLKDRRKFFYHTGDWETRLQKVLDKEATEESIEEANNLVRKLKTKKR